VSKKAEITALVPGASGWEIWQGQPSAGLTRRESSDVTHAGEILNLPNLDVVLFFPVKDATVLPFRAASADESLFADLAQMHCERMGLRTDPDAGKLIDSFVLETSTDSAVLATVALRAPQPGDMPTRSPKEFDYSPRAFAFPASGIAVWKEFGHWVFAFYQGGKMLYAQSTSNDAENPNDALLRDIKLALVQLSFQNITISTDEVRIWHPAGDLGEAGSLTEALGVTAIVTRRPDPAISAIPSKLLPADVQALRRIAAQRMQIKIIASVAAIAVLSLIGWAGWDLSKLKKKTDIASAAAAEVQPQIEEYTKHKDKWNELGPVVDSQQWPVEILFNIAKSIPPVGGMRLKEARINNMEVDVKGSSQDSIPIGTFAVNIERNEALQRFKFDSPQRNNSSKGWEFTLKGEVPQIPK
jgi:hypothetical protein